MIAELLDHLHNYFVVADGIHEGTYTISGGGITLSFLKPGQYFRILGSVFNDGVYKYPITGLADETFTGTVWALAVPPDVIAVSEEIDAWRTKYPESPFVSESFGNASYSRASGAGGEPITWQQAFRQRLHRWRKA
jgi:hypothetical protein